MEDPDIIKKDYLTSHRNQKMREITQKIENKQISIVCSKCHDHLHESDKPNIICPCGHIICNKYKDVEKCPICDAPVKDIKKIHFEEECTICYDKKCNTVSMPCGHFCMCYECAAKCAEKNSNCPMCNESLIGYKFLFNDSVQTIIDCPHENDAFVCDATKNTKLDIIKNNEILFNEIKCV